MIEQLWYTWTTKGLASDSGFQIRAASRGLMDTNSKRYHSFRGYLNYYLPQGTDPYAATTENSPICLAFLDFGDPDAPAQSEGSQRPSDKLEKNTHIVMQKVYKGKDAYGRPGVYFVHLIDLLQATKKDFPPIKTSTVSKGLLTRQSHQTPVISDTGREPGDFVACDAIDMWESGFWRTSDEPPPPGNALEWVKKEELQPGTFRQYAGAIQQVAEELHYLILAFLSLQENQKLYIAAPWQKVAALIWGLTHCLPRSLQRAQKLTFSTYEKDVTQAIARVVGTCQATGLRQNVSARPQQVLPATCFSGSGPALGLDCYTTPSQRAPLEEASPDIQKLAEYARYAIGLLMSGQKELLEEKLHLASENNVEDTDEFLAFIRANIPELDRTEWTTRQIDGLLKKLNSAAANLGGENVQKAIIRLCIEKPQWRQQVLPRLKQFRPFSSSQKADKSDRVEVMLRYAFSSLANQTAAQLAEVFKQDDNSYKAMQELFLVCAPPDYNPEAWNYLLACLWQQLSHQDFLRAPLPWERRTWLLQHLAIARNLIPIEDNLIRPWLFMGWTELHRLLDAKSKMPEEWRQIAIRDGIAGASLSGKNFQMGGAKYLFESHKVSFIGALAQMMQDSQTQAAASQFCTRMLNFDNKKYKHALDLVIEVLSIETRPPVDVQELLEAARLSEKDRAILIQTYGRELLSHPLTPAILRAIQEFLATVKQLIGQLDAKKLSSVTVRNTLDVILEAPLSDEDLRRVGYMKCISDTVVPKASSLIVKEQYLRNLGQAIRHFGLNTREPYMDGIYFLILKKKRNLNELGYIIENLAIGFRGSDTMENASIQLLEDITSYPVVYDYEFKPDWLSSYIQLALEYATYFEPAKRGQYLTPLLKKIINLNSASFMALEDRVKQDLEDRVRQGPEADLNQDQLNTYLALWNQYGAGKPTKPAPAKSRSEPVKERTPEREDQSSSLREQELEKASSSQDEEKDRVIVPEPLLFYKPVETGPARPQPAQPADDKTEKVDWGSRQSSFPLINQPEKKPLTGEQKQTDLSGVRASEVLSLVLDQRITRDELEKAYAVQKMYVPFRIRQLIDENKTLDKRKQELERQKKDREARLVAHQKDGVICEQEVLEHLQNHTSLKEMLTILENDVLINHALQQYPDALNIYQDILQSQAYQNMKKSPEYKRILEQSRGFDATNLFCAFVRYRVLERYFSEQFEPKQIGEWLRVQRTRVIRSESAFQLDREV